MDYKGKVRILVKRVPGAFGVLPVHALPPSLGFDKRPAPSPAAAQGNGPYVGG